VLAKKNATTAIRASSSAPGLCLSRWAFALAIPDLGRKTATPLARFHETLKTSHSPLLRDVLPVHEKRDYKEDSQKKIADRLVQSGLAKPIKANLKGRGITTEVGSSGCRKAFWDFLFSSSASAAGKKSFAG